MCRAKRWCVVGPVPRDDLFRSLGEPELVGDGERGHWMISGHHRHLDASRLARLNRSLHLGTLAAVAAGLILGKPIGVQTRASAVSPLGANQQPGVLPGSTGERSEA